VEFFLIICKSSFFTSGMFYKQRFIFVRHLFFYCKITSSSFKSIVMAKAISKKKNELKVQLRFYQVVRQMAAQAFVT